MTLPFYASAEQVMRDRSEYARKGIARGRSVVVLTYADGVLFVAENPSTALHKVSEIYDRIGFAAVGRYPEFENLRIAGVRYADVRGFSYDRRDVSGRALANLYAQTLGTLFSEQGTKPFEVEICVAEVGESPAGDQMYRLTYDGSVDDEPEYVVMGGHTEPIVAKLRETYQAEMSLADAVAVAVGGLAAVGSNGAPRQITAKQLEVAVLDRTRPTRKFKRLLGPALERLLAQDKPARDESAAAETTPSEAPETPAAPEESEPKGEDGPAEP